MSLVYRQNKMFKLNKNELPSSANNTRVINQLYEAMFMEFKGASENDKYSSNSYAERMEKLNKFAEDWLKKQGYKE